jgi:8-oxo-dGTP diphosphatase
MSENTDRQPRSGCGAAIVVDGRLLLLRRRTEPEAGAWGLPGGKVDWMETVAEAIQREVFEEVGVEVGESDLLCVVDHLDERLGQHWIAPVHLVSSFHGAPRLCEPAKHSGLSWFPLTELPERVTIATSVAVAELLRRSGINLPR